MQTMKRMGLCVLAAWAAWGGASAVELEIGCDEPASWTFNVTRAEDSLGREVFTVSATSPVPATPPTFDAHFTASGADAHNCWVPIYEQSERSRLFASEWGTVRYTSALAQIPPIACAFSESDENRLLIAASDCRRTVRFGLSCHSTDARLEGRFRFFTQPEAPLDAYEVKILVDRRRVFFGEAVAAATRWIERTAGLTPCPVPEAAFDSPYSSWYAFWQDVHAADLEKEARVATSLGMKSMILDDGWQKLTSKATYSATGDWMPAPARFPDIRKHVDAVHAAGIGKYLLWLSVPFVGEESAAFKRFGKMFLKRMGPVGVLDPRFPEVRRYLVDTYVRCVRDWDFDGLKLDFIDSFGVGGEDPAAKENWAGRDCRTVPEGVERLLKDVYAALTAVKPDVLIEFRQRYIGPGIRPYGNILRATDCPSDLVGNRRRIADLRLTSGTTAVHSDMLVWSPDDTPEDAGRVILNAIFGVVQYSMRLAEASESHRRVIRHWIDFAERHRAALLKGAFRPHHPELMYPLIEAYDDNERIVAVYGAETVARVADGRATTVLNATPASEVVVDLAVDADVAAYDVFGRPAGASRFVRRGLRRVACPVSGYLVFTSRCAAAAAIERVAEGAAAENAALQAGLADRCFLTDYQALVRPVNGTNAWSDAFQRALDEHEIVVVPASERPYHIDRPIVVPSNRRIEATGATVRLLDGVQTIMLRNRRTADGTDRPIPAGGRDANIAIVGGCWEDWHAGRAGYGRSSMYDPATFAKGSFYGVSTLFFFNNCDHVSLADVTFRHAAAFAVQAGDGDAYRFERIRFDACFADGLHLNGNLSRVLCRDVRGQVGDDLVALNAYDWLNSSVDFGPQRDIFCDGLELVHRPGHRTYPAIRLQPACYRYADGSVVDCAISNVVFHNVRGIMTFKAYFQAPGYRIGTEPEWGAVGSGGNLHFENIEIDLLRPIDLLGQYAASEPVRGHFGAFELGANLSGVHLKDIGIRFHADRYPLSHLVVVGPKSCVMERPDGSLREVFDPYASCRVEGLSLDGIRAYGVVPEDLVRETAFDDVNGDGRSSGRGVIVNVKGESAACRPAARFVTAPWWTSRLAETRGRIMKDRGACYDLVLVGDSITHRWENRANGAAVYPALRGKYKVLNLGSGGDSTQNVIWRFENNGELDDYTAKVFAVMIGVNNGASDPEGLVQGVEKIVGMIRARHPEAKILLQAILPHGKNPRAHVHWTKVNPMLRAYAEKNGFAWLDMGERFLGDDGEIKPGLMMPDNLHPIQAGYEIWLDELCPVVDRLLER